MANKKINAILYLSFFLSGVAGLIYEVLWARYLSLIFGNTAYAHTLVLATFMGGLALGSFWLGKLADRVKDRLAFYAWIEIGIALFCVFTPQLFLLSKDIYIAAAKNFSLNPAGIVAVKFIIGAFIILPPAILMGGTLPILSRFMIKSLSVRGRTVARLYYVNSFGAVVGAMVSGFYLIYRLGLAFSITTAAFISFLAGAMVLIVKDFPRRAPSKLTPQESLLQKEVDSCKEKSFSSRIVKISLIAIFLSGFAAMLYEIVWIRLLSLVLGSSTYSFSLMLAAFIFGITLGSWLISKFMPKPRMTFFVFGLCEIFIGILLIFSLPFYEKLPFLFLRLSGIFARTPQVFALYAATKFFLSFMVMLPPTLFLGMTLPLVSKIVSQKKESLGRKIGSVFAFNTSGNILGALITGLVLLPILGLKYTLELGVIINLLLGITILFLDKIFSLRTKFVFISICCLLFLGYKLAIPDWNKGYFGAQPFRRAEGQKVTFSEFSKRFGNQETLFYKDGLNASVLVAKSSSGELTLYVNGKVDASTVSDMPTQILLAQVPLIVKPEAKDVLVVGLGSGITCGSALLHPIETLDVAEISSAVAEANEYFAEFNYNALGDERLNLYQEDAKTFLQRSEEKYDLIISEPSNPWMSGVGALFSVEFFKDCLSHLNDGGLMVQWVQAYEMSDETYEIIIKTFSSVFSEVTIWNLGNGDTIFMGSNEEIALNLDGSKERIAQREIKEELARIKIYDLFTLFSLQLASSESVQEKAKMKEVVNSDYFPILDYIAPLSLYTRSMVGDFIKGLDERNLPLEKTDLFIKDYLKYHKMDHDALRNIFEYVSRQQTYNKNFLFALVKRWREAYPEDREAILAYTLYNIDFIESPLAILESLISKDSRLRYLNRYASLQVEKYLALRSFLLPEIFSDVAEKLKMCLSLSEDKKARFYCLLGKISLMNKDYADSIDYYRKAEELITSREDAKQQGIDYLDFLSNLSFAYLGDGNTSKALEYIKKITLIDKDNSFAQSTLGCINKGQKNF